MKARRAVAGALLLVCALAPLRAAHAHEVRPAVLALKELSPGRFSVHWSPPSDGQRTRIEVKPRFPEQCRFESETLIDCGAQGLDGAIRFDEGAEIAGVSVAIDWFQGPKELRLASGDPAVLFVAGTPERASLRQRAEIAGSYGVMGVTHILSGVDHLMFVAGLLLFVSSWRRLLATITSFTFAHSLTLAASTLGFVHVPRGPVELCIALSILLLAVEATRRHRTWTHRAPWVVAFSFGLLHGFGFASALSEVGLPPQHLPLALASFNVGVEAGQLFAVAALAAGYRLLARSPSAVERVKGCAVYVLGVSSVYWCLDRAVTMWVELR